MLKIIYISIITIFCYIQGMAQSNSIQLEKSVQIKHIHLSRSFGNEFSKNRVELLGISLYRENDSVSFYTKTCSDEVIENHLPRKSYKISSQIFDTAVQYIAQISPENIDHDFNIYDGINYSIQISDRNYSITMSTNKIGFSESPDITKFKIAWDFIWKQFKL